MSVKIYEPEPEPLPAHPDKQTQAWCDMMVRRCKRRTKKQVIRCRCGCGKPARWPKDGRPVFYTRLCGYLLALKMFRRKKV